MLAILVASAIVASLLIELGLMVARTLLEAAADEHEDERQMNSMFKRTSGAVH